MYRIENLKIRYLEMLMKPRTAPSLAHELYEARRKAYFTEKLAKNKCRSSDIRIEMGIRISRLTRLAG